MNPYAVYDEIEEKRLEDEHYREIILEQQGMDAETIYNKLPLESTKLFSDITNKYFGNIFEDNIEAMNLLNDFLYSACLLVVKQKG
ncbi:hypothetical protein CE143_20045 [Photorhabdus luminescens]|uniref:Uncharacterized protein n=1 Tax=Photorhabdus akhurstii TaxID=171438 RepID=A0ABX8LY81_9GAMM|nr:hypothetical protein [Photorhabdus akhurstii]QXF35203.1 hypothetical protein B0X70_20000 [Photorhabdus akhurstii]UJD77036.1 hypothetical protein CE143_20045 [Photorhabdus luminescens]